MNKITQIQKETEKEFDEKFGIYSLKQASDEVLKKWIEQSLKEAKKEGKMEVAKLFPDVRQEIDDYNEENLLKDCHQNEGYEDWDKYFQDMCNELF